MVGLVLFFWLWLRLTQVGCFFLTPKWLIQADSNKEKHYKEGKRWILSPSFWTKLRILLGDDSVPASKEELNHIIVDEIKDIPEGKSEEKSQDDISEGMVFLRVRDQDGKTHLVHLNDGSKAKGNSSKDNISPSSSSAEKDKKGELYEVQLQNHVRN